MAVVGSFGNAECSKHQQYDHCKSLRFLTALALQNVASVAGLLQLESKDPIFALCATWCVHSRGGAGAAATAGAERAADAAEANLLENLPEKLDEFGRDENVELREEMSRRASKRTAQYSTPPAQPQVCSTSNLITVDAYCACQLRPRRIARHHDSDHGKCHCLGILLPNSTCIKQHS